MNKKSGMKKVSFWIRVALLVIFCLIGLVVGGFIITVSSDFGLSNYGSFSDITYLRTYLSDGYDYFFGSLNSLSGFAILIFERGDSVEYVDPIIDKEFENASEIPVIVFLDEDLIWDLVGSGKEIGVIRYTAVNGVLLSLNEKEFKKKHQFSSVSGFSGNVTQKGLEKLKKDRRVKKIFFDGIRNTMLGSSVPMINASFVHGLLIRNVNISGRDQGICILDTGINYTHEMFGSCSNSTFLAGNCTKVIGGYDFVNSDNNPYDDQGHGTHVGGIAAGNSSSLVGVAPNAKIIAIKVCDNSQPAASCSDSNILSGIDWCVSNRTLYNTSVISMSLGGGLYSNYCDGTSPFTSSINDAVGKNITVVISTGNSGSTTRISDPACVNNATAVGGVTKADVLVYNRNNITDLVAPAVDINSSVIGGGYDEKDGTSMATPHVAGAVALLQHYKKEESNRSLTVVEVEAALENNGKNITDSTGVILHRVDVLGGLIGVDNLAPSLIVDSPGDGANYAGTTVNVNYIASDTLLGNCFYSLNSGANVSITGCANTTVTGNIGSNTLIVYANDSAGNLNQSSKTFSMVISTSLVSPANYLNTSNNNVTFNCSALTASTRRLTNISLYHNLSGQFIANQTAVSSGTSNSSTFSFTNVNNGVYIWNCLSCTNASECAWSTSNYTLTVDTIKPWFSNIQASSITSSSAVISWNTNEATNATVHYNAVNGSLQSKSDTTFSTSHSVSLSSLSASTVYYYNVSGSDYSENYNVSSQGSFTTGASGNGGSSGRGSGSSSTVAEVSETEMKASFGSVSGGSETKFPVTKEYISVREISFFPNKDLKGIEVGIADLGGGKIGALPEPSVSGEQNVKVNVYRYFFVNKENISDSDIDKVVIKFRALGSWLRDNGFVEGDIVLFRNFGGSWNELETKATNEDNSFVYYESVSNGFSFFAIGGKKKISAGGEEMPIAEDGEKGAGESKEISIKRNDTLDEKERKFILNLPEIGKAWIVLIFVFIALVGYLVYYFEKKHVKRGD